MKAVTPGRLDLRLGTSMIVGSARHLATCPDLGPACRGPVAPTPYYHDVSLFTAEVTLDAAYGITPWLAAEVRLPLRIIDTSPTYTDLKGKEFPLPNDIHHHNRTLVGLADPWMVVRLAGATGKLTTATRLGISLPVGTTRPNPYTLADQGKFHEHSQFGSGTFMPIVGLGLSYDFDPLRVSATGLGVFGLYENGHGFLAPSRFFFGIRAMMPFRNGSLRPYLAVDLPVQTNELWSGSIGGEGPTARTELLVGGGLSWEFRAPWSVDLGLRARVARFTDAATFSYPGLLQVGLTTSFDTAPARSDVGSPTPSSETDANIGVRPLLP